MKIFREEKFGGVIFDTDTLKFRLTEIEETYDKYIPLENYQIRSDILSAPIRVYFEITRRCNLHCKHCFVSASHNNYLGLPNEDILHILDDLNNSNVIDIRFTGGEPTFRDDWYDIVAYAKDKGFVVSINTNGVYSNPAKIISQMEELDLDQITISLDGSKKYHDYIRGNGNYDKTVDTIKEMAKRGLILRINTVINKLNVNSIPEMLEFASKYVKEINFFYMRSIGRATNIKDLSLGFWEHYDSAKYAIGKKEDYPNLNIMHFEQSFVERSITKSSQNKFGLLRTYPYGSTTFNIAADGSYWPHGYSTYQMEYLKLGKYPDQSMLEIWHNSENLDKLRQWFAELIDFCSKCEHYMHTCAGINFESEISRMMGNSTPDRLCIKQVEFPKLDVGNY